MPAASNMQYSWGGACGLISQLNFFPVHLSALFFFKQFTELRFFFGGGCIGGDFGCLN